MPRTLSTAVYSQLNAKQKELYNFQLVSAVFADLGFATYRLMDDWNGADFFAVPFNGDLPLKVQLKTRVIINGKYRGKDLYICFRDGGRWYLFPHDEVFKYVTKNKNVLNTKGWEGGEGTYSWPSPPKWLLQILQQFELKAGWTHRSAEGWM